MIAIPEPNSFFEWRETVRKLISQDKAPAEVIWTTNKQRSFFETKLPSPRPPSPASFRVPRWFLLFAETAALHSSTDKWDLLYRILWRMLNEKRELLSIKTDPEVSRFWSLIRDVRADAHRMKGFLRFEPRSIESTSIYTAWYRPDHRVLRLVCPFFQKRFSSSPWAILTPQESVRFLGKSLEFGQGVQSIENENDEFTELWKTFYTATCSKERLRPKTMKSFMPKRYWEAMPEGSIIEELIRETPLKYKPE